MIVLRALLVLLSVAWPSWPEAQEATQQESLVSAWIRDDASAVTKQGVPLDEVRAAVIKLLGSLASADAITEFRRWPGDDSVVEALVPYAAGDDKAMRIPASLVLGNVVDNTNVCFVLERLILGGEGLSVNGRFNLLQVVLQVANYAFSDVSAWMKGTVAVVRARVELESDVDATALLLDRIVEVLDGRSAGKDKALASYNSPKYANCAKRLATKLPTQTQG